VTAGSAARIMRLIAHLHLTPTLRMCRAIPPLHHTPPWLTQRQLYIVLICSKLQTGILRNVE